MITLHHLRIGRSLYTIWLLEELGCEYQLKTYHRDQNMRAPAELKNVHPLGKSPVIEHDGLVLSESGAITSYLLALYDQDHALSPSSTDLKAWANYNQWLHYPEASVFMPVFMQVLLLREANKSEIIAGFCQAEAKLHLDNIAQQLGDNSYILGESLSGADFGLAFVINLANQLNLLQNYPNLSAYLERIKSRPAFKAAVEKGVE